MKAAARTSGAGLTRSALWKRSGACNRIICQSIQVHLRTCHAVFTLTCSFLLERQHLSPGERVLSPSRQHFCLEPSFPTRFFQLVCLLFLSASGNMPSALPFPSAASSSPFQLLPSTSLYFGTSHPPTLASPCSTLSRRLLCLPRFCLPILLPRRPGPFARLSTFPVSISHRRPGTIPPSQLVSFLQPEHLLFSQPWRLKTRLPSKCDSEKYGCNKLTSSANPSWAHSHWLITRTHLRSAQKHSMTGRPPRCHP